MTIRFPVDVPLQEFSGLEVEAVNVNSLQSSTFTGKDRVQEFDGDYWRLRMTYRDLGREDGRKVAAFVHSLRTSAGTFVVRFPGYGKPVGLAATIISSPLVDGGAQGGNRELKIKSAPPSIDGWLLAGDIIQVGPDNRPHWHTILADVDTAADGTATLDIWPSVRADVVNNDLIITDDPRGLCRLITAPSISISHPVIHSLQLECREALV